jgi:hypothetical protein
VLVLKTEVGLFYVWHGHQGLIGCSRDTFDIARRHAREFALSYGASLRSRLRAEFLGEEYRLLWATPDSEIIAEACTHRRDGPAWRNLSNPLLLRPTNSRTTGIYTPKNGFGSEVTDWLAERPWTVEPVWMKARTVKAHKTFARLSICVLDFEEPHHAFEFKMCWL